MKQGKHAVSKLITIIILLLAVMTGGCSSFGFFSSEGDEETVLQPVMNGQGSETKPEPTDDLDSVRVSLIDYDCYRLEDIAFAFVIARVHVTAGKPTNIPLSHFRTSEGILLNEVSGYVNELEKKSYYLGRQNVWFSLVSSKEEYDANIFIPVKDTARDSISLLCDFGSNEEMKFELKENVISDSQPLYYETDDVITDGRTYQMKVSSAQDMSGERFYEVAEDGTQVPYTIPSYERVFAMQVEAVSLWGDTIVVESAEFIPYGTTESIRAMPADIRSTKLSNMIAHPIRDRETGYLFFETYGFAEDEISFTGTLNLKLQDSDTWITVNVNLE